MATKKKKKHPGTPTPKQLLRRTILRWILNAFLVLCVSLGIYMYIEAHLVRLHYATVYLNDLPEVFDGTTLLFVSDIHIDSIASPKNAYNVIAELSSLNPDILLLGGDYSSVGLSDAIFSFGRSNALNQREAKLAQFFSLLNNISAPLGKYGVVGNHDAIMDEDMALLMSLGGVRLLKNDLFRIEKGNDSIVIAGLDDWRTGTEAIYSVAERVDRDECVILMSHSPDAFPAVNNHAAKNGGLFADLTLSGHTHGGQITLFGLRAITTSSIYGERYKSGWYTESGVHLLVSNGVGTFMLPLRLGAEPQAHFITLRRRSALAADQ